VSAGKAVIVDVRPADRCGGQEGEGWARIGLIYCHRPPLVVFSTPPHPTPLQV
jgi:hypothetical protein